MEKLKGYIKIIIGKLPIFVFCVLFINTYNTIFGRENTIVGVILLMALLMLMKSDFGYSHGAAAVMIPVTFVAMGILAKVAVIHPLLGVIVNTLVIVWILILTREDKTQSNYLPFMMGYLMFSGYDVSGDLYEKRMLSLVIIGTLIGLIHYLCNMNIEVKKSFGDMFTNVKVEKDWRRWATVFTITLVFAMFIGAITNYPKNMWINLTVLSLIPPIEEDIETRKKLRIPATLIGCVLMFVLFGYLIPPHYQTTVMLVAGFLSMFITSYFVKTIYNSFSALVTAVIIMPAKDAVLVRMSCNIIGAIITVASLFLFKLIFEKIDRKRIQ